MSYTPNLNLLLTPEDDTTTTFKEWRTGTNGEEGNSNMTKIDEAYGALSEQTQEMQANYTAIVLPIGCLPALKAIYLTR